MNDVAKKEEQICREEFEICKQFVNSIMEMSIEYDLNFSDELKRLGTIVANSISKNTEEDKDVE